MRKSFIAIALVFAASFGSLASAQSSEASASASAAQSTAFKAGAWLRGAIQAPMEIGKSFVAGVSSIANPGHSTVDQPALKSYAEVAAEVPASKAPFTYGMTAAESNPGLMAPLDAIRNQISVLLAAQQRKASEGLAPVEDRSVYISER